MTTISSLTTQWINLCPHPVNDYNFVINNTTDKPNFVFKLLQVQLDVFQKCFLQKDKLVNLVFKKYPEKNKVKACTFLLT